MASDYTILSQSQTTEINPAGSGFMQVWEITYRVTAGAAKGTVGTLQVPEEDHDAEHVKAAIEAKIAQLHDVASLGNG